MGKPTMNREDLDLDQDTTLKVTIPAKLHLRLHQLKILTGTNISDTVANAVGEFFEDEGDVPEGMFPGGQ